jgi:indole-3-acetate monooxygenase
MATIVDTARELRDLVEAHADASEEATTLAPPLVSAFTESGLFNGLVPRELGGGEHDIVSWIEAAAEISYADGSAGWSLIANGTTNAFAGAFTGTDCANALFGAGSVTNTAGMLGPVGAAIPDEGGFTVQGKYSFGSGCNHATHFGGGAVVLVDGKPVMRPDGRPDMRVYFVPREKTINKGNWDVMGLVATGSFDYVVPPTHVDDAWTFELLDAVPQRGGPLYNLGVLGLTASGHAAVAIGVARRVIDEIAVLATTKKRMVSPNPIADQQLFRHDFAQHDAAVRAAVLYTYDAFAAAQASVDAGTPLTPVTAQRMRQATTYVTRVAADAARFAYTWAGTNGLRNGNIIQRCFRDAHAATQHIFVDNNTYTDYAAAVLAG